ncbi:actin-related protein 10 isoform X1 [Cyprinus carpio]|uniref:Actin-related protein 10 n=1 Tax=Cyprinus carpio TaxID=7962 RepID=A0A9R0AV09_CYPCA|nr:actin-related protein 10 isoform X1 [Cyprinus carpio]
MPLFEGLGSGGEKTAVVVDLGAAYTKCGFLLERRGPRFIIPSEIKRAGSPEAVRVVQYNINTEELYSILKEFVHLLYFRHLLVNPRDRRVVIVESILCPSHFRETLSRVFFKHFEVPSVLFAPSHLMSVMTLGIQSALVMDCGYTETLVLPIYEGVPILSAWEALPMGGKAIHRELHSLLSEQCTLDTDSGTGLSLRTVINSIPEDVVEDIKVRTCFVSDLQRGMKIQEARFNLDGSAERPAPPPDVEYPLDGQKILHVKGAIRDSVAEMLFEQDNEEKSIATLLLDTLVKCPIDTRKVLSENLVIIGGTSMLPGFLHRLLSEIRSLVEKPKYRDAATKSFRIHSPPAKPNCTAWLGGAIFLEHCRTF